jgi:uncharacterized protein YrrD
MNKTILISEMLKFHFGSKIFCSDGEGGVLAQVIFDPATLSMTNIGVKHGRLFGKSVFLPFDCIISANEAGITLNVKRSDVAAAQSKEQEGAVLTSKSIVEHAESAAKGSMILVAVHPTNGELA